MCQVLRGGASIIAKLSRPPAVAANSQASKSMLPTPGHTMSAKAWNKGMILCHPSSFDPSFTGRSPHICHKPSSWWPLSCGSYPSRAPHKLIWEIQGESYNVCIFSKMCGSQHMSEVLIALQTE